MAIRWGSPAGARSGNIRVQARRDSTSDQSADPKRAQSWPRGSCDAWVSRAGARSGNLRVRQGRPGPLRRRQYKRRRAGRGVNAATGCGGGGPPAVMRAAWRRAGVGNGGAACTCCAPTESTRPCASAVRSRLPCRGVRLDFTSARRPLSGLNPGPTVPAMPRFPVLAGNLRVRQGRRELFDAVKHAQEATSRPRGRRKGGGGGEVPRSTAWVLERC